MDSSTLLSLVGAALVLSIILLASICLHCKGNSQSKYISQDYQQSSHGNHGFALVRSYTENPLPNTLPTQNSLPIITSPMADPRRSSACPSFDYNNEDPGNGYEAPPDKNQDYPDYLDVLPDDPHVSQNSLASSANSGQNYENVNEDTGIDDDDDDSDSQQYINVAPENTGSRLGSFQTPIGSLGSCSSDGQGSSDYVNAPNQEFWADPHVLI
ncbi:linker for activation of T-cells family member 1 isoform X2 [Colossoma macropomum]|uniref:linker for activation of T-cells family member 1 isoform X2 n=1 Tax=Colossoma macropomum TaxID=42526 RepID=UPI0018652068|nr:linker for activation of T-cells family member 1 isoform X2 [Colossoma macropomum]